MIKNKKMGNRSTTKKFLAPEPKDEGPNIDPGVPPAAQSLAKVPALIVLGVLAYFAFKK